MYIYSEPHLYQTTIVSASKSTKHSSLEIWRKTRTNTFHAYSDLLKRNVTRPKNIHQNTLTF